MPPAALELGPDSILFHSTPSLTPHWPNRLESRQIPSSRYGPLGTEHRRVSTNPSIVVGVMNGARFNATSSRLNEKDVEFSALWWHSGKSHICTRVGAGDPNCGIREDHTYSWGIKQFLAFARPPKVLTTRLVMFAYLNLRCIRLQLLILAYLSPTRHLPP